MGFPGNLWHHSSLSQSQVEHSEALLSSIMMTALLTVQGHESPTESRYAPSEASVSSVHEDPSLDDDAASRITSNSLASSSRGSHSSACHASTSDL